MILREDIGSNTFYHIHSDDICVGDYYNYCVSLLRGVLQSNSNMNINLVFGNIHPVVNGNKRTIRTDIQFEHTIVRKGGRDSHVTFDSGILTPDGEPYNIRVPHLDYYNRLDMVIDYSYPNLHNIKSNDILKTLSDKVAVVSPVLYEPYTSNTIRNKDIITSFIDTNQPRRKSLLDGMGENGIVSENIRTFDRDGLSAILRDTKILVNIHQTDHHHTLEEFRVLPALLNGVIVICEESPLKDKVPYHDLVVWSTYEDMIETIKDVRDNYEHYRYTLLGDGSKVNRLYNTLSESNIKNITDKLT